MSLEEQEEAALFSRPELLEIRYQEKVTAAEARASKGGTEEEEPTVRQVPRGQTG